MKRRVLLPVAVLLLGGTLIAQQGATVATAQPQFMVSKSVQEVGDILNIQGFRLVFPTGANLTADEAVVNIATGTIDLSGNVRLTNIVPKAAK